jgi:hypothetical protein
MSSNTNTNPNPHPLLVQNRARLDAIRQAQQARRNAAHQRRQVALQANQLATFAARNPAINPAQISQTLRPVIFGGASPSVFAQLLPNFWLPNPPPPFQQPALQHHAPQNVVSQTHALPHVLAIQNAAPVNTAAPPQVNPAPKCNTISPLLTFVYADH